MGLEGITKIIKGDEVDPRNALENQIVFDHTTGLDYHHKPIQVTQPLKDEVDEKNEFPYRYLK